ncbi:MAG TPA: hypothetical protein PKA85_12640, partial [Ferruginibacter sp.]|nr:hypothetical protein [Ferruginibacter sp.]
TYRKFMANAITDILQLMGNSGNNIPAFTLPSDSIINTEPSGRKIIMNKAIIPVMEKRNANL